MTDRYGWFLENVDELAVTNPEFFRHPVRAIQDRMAIRLGEMVKLAIHIVDEDGSRLYARWVIVTEVSQTVPVRYVGKLGPFAEDDGRRPRDGRDALTFGPEHVYRLEPREFTLWGNEGVPVTITGGNQLPVLEDQTPFPGCNEIIEQFRAESGWAEAMAFYAKLAETKPHWPAADDLGACGP